MSKRQIPKAFFEPLEEVTLSELLKNRTLLGMIRKEAPIAIQDAHQAKKTFATLFEVNGLGVYLEIPRTYWVPALEQCIQFMIDEEQFEQCAALRNLIDEIKKPTRKVSKTKKNGSTAKRNTKGS